MLRGDVWARAGPWGHSVDTEPLALTFRGDGRPTVWVGRGDGGPLGAEGLAEARGQVCGKMGLVWVWGLQSPRREAPCCSKLAAGG